MRLIIFILFSFIFSFAQKPALMLLDEYKNQNITGWLMSEKLDGVRAYWDGEKLISRNGNIFPAPLWFIKDFPPFAIDGELWSKEGDFENILSIVSKKELHVGWRELKFYVFDAPSFDGGLLKRLEHIKSYQNNVKSDYLHVLEQTICKDKPHLESFLNEVMLKGGEGVVIREGSSNYLTSRNQLSLKVKKFHDAECKIVELHAGKGRLKNSMGSFTCELENGKTFKIGSGLNNTIKNSNTLQIGEIITFKHQGFTKNEIPRFPIFLRVKKD